VTRRRSRDRTGNGTVGPDVATDVATADKVGVAAVVAAAVAAVPVIGWGTVICGAVGAGVALLVTRGRCAADGDLTVATGDTPAGRVNRRQRPSPDAPFWERVHPLTCGECDPPSRDTDPLIAFDRPDGGVDLRCRRHPGYRQVVPAGDPLLDYGTGT